MVTQRVFLAWVSHKELQDWVQRHFDTVLETWSGSLSSPWSLNFLLDVLRSCFSLFLFLTKSSSLVLLRKDNECFMSGMVFVSLSSKHYDKNISFLEDISLTLSPQVYTILVFFNLGQKLKDLQEPLLLPKVASEIGQCRWNRNNLQSGFFNDFSEQIVLKVSL